MTAKNTSVMADKVFVGTIDSNTKLSVKVIDQLNLKSEPQYLCSWPPFGDQDHVYPCNVNGTLS